MAGFKSDSHWRDSARLPRFWIFDAQACFPFLLWLLHITWWTFFTALFCIMFFTYLNRRGFSVIVFLRWLRYFFAGNRKMARPWWL